MLASKIPENLSLEGVWASPGRSSAAPGALLGAARAARAASYGSYRGYKVKCCKKIEFYIILYKQSIKIYIFNIFKDLNQ